MCIVERCDSSMSKEIFESTVLNITGREGGYEK